MTEHDISTAVPRRPGPGRDAFRMRRPGRSREGAPGRRHMLRNTLPAAPYAAGRLAGDVLSPLMPCHRPRRTTALTGLYDLAEARAGTRPGLPRRGRGAGRRARAAPVHLAAGGRPGPDRPARRIDRLTPVMTDASLAARVTLSRFLRVTDPARMVNGISSPPSTSWTSPNGAATRCTTGRFLP